MSERGDGLENGIGERGKGILKREWVYRMRIGSGKVCKKEVRRIIGFYKEERGDMSMGNERGCVGDSEGGGEEKMWKNGWENCCN